MRDHLHFPALIAVIVNYRRSSDTISCIKSLLSNGLEESQIIVVDNGSRDDSTELIPKQYPKIQFYVLLENLGFSGGYNFGIQQALAGLAQQILILNNDTVIEPGSIYRLMESDWDIAVPKILYYDNPNVIWAAGCRWRKLPPSVVMIGHQKIDQKKYDQTSPLKYATGCALMIRRNPLVELGGFDPLYKNYMEDYDFCYRAQLAGYTIGYVPKARILHKVSQTLGTHSPERWKQQGRNTVLFYRKSNRFPGWMLWAYIVWFVLREIIKFQFSILLPFLQGIQMGFIDLREI